MPDFADWRPDAYQLDADVASEASGVLVKVNAYSPFPQPAVSSIAPNSSTVTITIASPGVVTWTAHGLLANDSIVFTTTGTLPTGITAGTTYYVLATSLTTNTFKFSTSMGGSAVNTSVSQSGTHTATYTGG